LELYYIHIYEDLGKRLSVFDLIEFPVETESNPLDTQLIERLIEINSGRELQHYDPYSYNSSVALAHNIATQQKSPIAFEMETQGIIKQLISRFLVKSTYKNEHIEKRVLKSLHYIHTNIEKPISIDSLAEMSSLTKDHFIRLFKEEIGFTPGKYIIKKKIEAAQLQFLIDNSDINDIAHKLGFDNVPYFSMLFTKMTGESPSRYRKIAKHQTEGTFPKASSI